MQTTKELNTITNPDKEFYLRLHNLRNSRQNGLGPFVIVSVHVNGTVVIQRQPNVEERINIRRLKPFRE